MSNYTNNHLTFNKGEYVGHLEPPIDEIPQTLGKSRFAHKTFYYHRKNDGRKVKPDTFKPSHHKLEQNI